LSGPERDIAAASPGLPLDTQGEPVFFEPWQAKAFAMTLALHEKGLFSWTEWAEALGRACAESHAPPQGSAQAHAQAYFTAWLTALEDILTARGLFSADILQEITQTWHRAAEATPHGTPIRYEAGLSRSTD
jgi:nitrile hydratase accessory protein